METASSSRRSIRLGIPTANLLLFQLPVVVVDHLVCPDFPMITFVASVNLGDFAQVEQ